MEKRSPHQQKNKHSSPEELGNMLVNIYESGYLDHNKAYKMSFIKGVMGGLGGVIGATIVLGLLLWILTLFKSVPLVGRFTESVRDTVDTRQQ